MNYEQYLKWVEEEKDIEFCWNSMTFEERMDWLLDDFNAILAEWSETSWKSLPEVAKQLLRPLVKELLRCREVMKQFFEQNPAGEDGNE